jgi:predicted DNA-binding protein (UPF0251 family)
VTLFKETKRRQRFIHHIVGDAFIGPRPAGCLLHHRDEDRMNNNVGNLKYLTPAKHSLLHNAIISQEEVTEIRTLAAEGVRQCDLAKYFGISGGHIHSIVRNKRRRGGRG